MHLYSTATAVLVVLFCGGFGVAVGTMIELMLGMIQLRKEWQ